MTHSFNCFDSPWESGTNHESISRSRYHLAKILGQNDLKGFLSGKDWPPQLGYSVELVADAAERNTEKLEFILDYIPAKWDSKNPPRKSAIFDFRNKYKAMRDGILAHIKDDGAVAHPLVDEITEYVRLSHELVMAAAFILDGSSLATGDVYSLAEKSARKFWSYAEVGAIQTHHVDSERLRTY